MKSLKRWVAIGLTASVAAVGLEMAAPVVASATQVDLKCDGITGDNASSLGDSKATLALLSTLSPGGGGGLTFSVEATTNAPAKATPGAGPFDATFDLALTLPDSVVKPAKELLKLSSVQVTNATFGITASGAADAELSTSLPALTVDLNTAPVVVRQSISGKIDPKRSGTIIYRPGRTKMTIVINATVAGITINSLTVECGGSKDIATTAVQIPGAPNVVQPIYQVAWTATVVGRPLVGKEITPDNGNPLTPDSLKLVSQAPNGGYSAVGGGAAFFLAPREPGLYNAEYEVCAASKIVPEVPGVNTVQTLSWPEAYVGRDLNAHPIAMTLQFKGAKSKPIPLSYFNFLGQLIPGDTDPAQLDAQEIFGEFRAPSAAAIQTALEGISTIGKGNVTVTGGAQNAPYNITFKGALGLSEQPKIEIVDFNSWLPGSILTGALGALNPPPPPAGTPTTVAIPIVPLDQLFQQLFAGQITQAQFEERVGATIKSNLIGGLTTPANINALTKLFPKPPEVAIATIGKPTVPQTETGPLCSSFTIGYFVIPNPTAVLGASQTRTTYVTKCSYKRVKVKGKYVKRKVCSKVAVKKK